MCIKLGTGVSLDQQAARTACQAENTDLVIIDSKDKTDFVLQWIFYNKGKFSKCQSHKDLIEHMYVVKYYSDMAPDLSYFVTVRAIM